MMLKARWRVRATYRSGRELPSTASGKKWMGYRSVRVMGSLTTSVITIRSAGSYSWEWKESPLPAALVNFCGISNFFLLLICIRSVCRPEKKQGYRRGSTKQRLSSPNQSPFLSPSVTMVRCILTSSFVLAPPDSKMSSRSSWDARGVLGCKKRSPLYCCNTWVNKKREGLL
jgi:hypothetical protein